MIKLILKFARKICDKMLNYLSETAMLSQRKGRNRSMQISAGVKEFCSRRGFFVKFRMFAVQNSYLVVPSGNLILRS